MTRRVVAALEARCWEEGGVVIGRQRAAALDELTASAELMIISRRTTPESGGQPVLQGEHTWAPLAGIRGIATAIRSLVTADVVVVYLPGLVSLIMGPIAVMTRRRLVCIVAGDPMFSLGPDVLPGARGWLARHVFTQAMRWLLKRASVVRYVTQTYLQRRYPAPGAKAFSATDAKPGVAKAKVREGNSSRRVLTVGTLDRPYKGIPDLVRALELCVGVVGPIELLVAGSGRLHDRYVGSASAEGLRVTPLGQLTEDALNDAYASVDVFALASWTEGLPRTLVEAMTAGLPCVATEVGGVPELLEARVLAQPRNAESLARVLLPVLTDADLRAELGTRNRRVIEEVLATAEKEAEAFALEVVS